MENPTVIYPRFLIRTSRACAIVMILEFVLMMVVLATSFALNAKAPPALVFAFGCAAMSVGISRRALLQLQRLETTRPEPDELMLALFDTSLGASTLGLLAVIGSTLP